MFISAVKLDLTWRSMGIDSLLKPASSGTSALASFFSPDVATRIQHKDRTGFDFLHLSFYDGAS